MEAKRRPPGLYRNWLTYAGGLLSLLGLVFVLVGMLFQIFAGTRGRVRA